MSAIPRTKLAVANPLTRPLIIAVAGNPNAGKTSLFNALTGMRQKVANYPGVTVERKVGLWTLAPELPPAQLIDLPGLYSLEATSLDEQIARDALLGRAREMPTPDAVIVVVDATNLVRNLYLASQLIETKQPVVIALTMFDIAERQKLSIDVAKLGAALGVPVVPVVAKQQRGTTRLAEAVLAVIAEAESRPDRRSERVREDTTTCAQSLINRYHWIEKVVAGSLNRPHEQAKASPTERIDRVLTHKFFGPAVLLLVMLLIFQAIFSWASLPMYIIERIFNVLSETVRLNLPPGVLADLLAGGVIPGVGGVLVFLPQIFLLFLFISMLEDSGYMARAVFLTDRVMRSLGLQGRALMPLLSSFACAVPGIMATRTIEDPKDRLTTILIAPFMSCSARLPVYTLMIATFFSEQKVLGQISLGVVILLSLYLLGITAAVVVAWILKHTILKASPSPFVMELPPYRLPSFTNVGHAILMRCGLFVKRAGTVILAISILLWALAAFPRSPNGQSTASATQNAQNNDEAAAQIRNSYAGRAGRMLEPLIAPLGFDWKIGIGLISSFAARETIISTLSIVYGVGADPSGRSTTLNDALRNARRPDGSPAWTPLVGISLMVFFVLACQCMSTLAVVRRETNSWRWPLFLVSYMLVLAYVGSMVTYQGGRLLGFS